MTKSHARGSREVSELIPVTNTLTGKHLGRIVALSAFGMQVACNPGARETLRDGALYQLTFALPGDPGGMHVQCGIEVMSSEDVPGRNIKLVHVRFILIDPAITTRIGQWCAATNPGPA